MAANDVKISGTCRRCGITIYEGLRHECPPGLRRVSAAARKSKREYALELTKQGHYRQAKQLFAEIGDFINISAILAREERWAEAIEAANEALLINPVKAHIQLAGIYGTVGDLANWEAHAEAGLALEPTNARLRQSRGLLRLGRGDFAGGWEDLKYRGWYRHPAKDAPTPEWDGSDLTGKTIVVLQEQGMGDQLLYARCIPWIWTKNPKQILIHPNDSHVRLFEKSFPDCKIVTADTPNIPKTDAWVSMMSLPILGAPFDWKEFYLDWPHECYAKMAEHIPKTGRLRVGICWAGGPGYEHDKYRSLPFESLKPILDVEGVDFYALQFGIEASNNNRIPDLSLLCDDFADTAGALAHLDLLITTDTSIANLAGALDMPCWVMVRTPIDYRWGFPEERKDWFPNVRQFRDTIPAVVAEALKQRVNPYMRSLPAPEGNSSQSAVVTLNTRYGKMEAFTYDMWLTHSLRSLGEFSEGEMDVMRAMLPKDRPAVVIEAGANIGAHTVALIRSGLVRKIYAFEPQKQAFDLLIRNAREARRPHVQVLFRNEALGSREDIGFMVPANPRFPANIGGCELLLKEYPEEIIPNGEQVQITTIDDVLRKECLAAIGAYREAGRTELSAEETKIARDSFYEDNHIDLIKADVEGCELPVVLGAIQTIRQYRPVLYLEENEPNPELRRLLLDWGYKVVLHKIPLWNPENFNRNPINPFGWIVSHMLLCVPEEREDLLKSDFCGGIS